MGQNNTRIDQGGQPFRVNNDAIGNGKDQWFPNIAIEPDDAVDIVFYDSRNDANNLYTNCYVARSVNGGTTFNNYLVSDVPFIPIPISGAASGYMGDYLGIVAKNNEAFPVWMDNRTGSYQIYTDDVQFNINVSVDQVDANNSRLTGTTIGKWEGGPNFNQYTIGSSPIVFTSLTYNSPFAIEGYQQLVENSTQKYFQWNSLPDVTNFHLFSVKPKTSNLTSHFNFTYSGVTIQDSLSEYPGYNLSNTSIGFSDPWLIDYPDPSYGNIKRNEGMSAPFKARPAPFYPNLTSNYNGDVYQGIFLNQRYDVPNPVYYLLNFPSNQTINIAGINHSLVLWNWSSTGTGANFQNANSAQTPVVFTSGNAVITAKIKASQISSITSAYSNNNQRKFVRTPTDGCLHMVYESLGHVWYEMSANNGASWSIMNGGQPLDNGGGKLPSIDYANYTGTGGVPGNKVVIAFEQQNGYIVFNEFYASGGTYVFGLSNIISSGGSYSDNFNPVISANNNEDFMITWAGSATSVNPGINYAYGYFDNNIYQLVGTGFITGTNANSANPTIYTNKSYTGFNRFNIAFEQYNPSTGYRDIDYAIIETYSGGSSSVISGPTNISTGSGSILNYRPSIFATSDGGARVCWIADINGNGNLIETGFRDPNYTHFWFFGNNVVSTSINAADDNSAYYIAWSQNTSGNNYQNQFTDSGTLSHISTVNTTGKDIQLSNGSSKAAMYVSSFSPFAVPYFFTTSNNLNSFPKSNPNAINSGRGGVITKNEAQFFYTFGDLTVDNHNIDFVKISDTVKNYDLNKINNVLVTNPFTVNNNSTFTFSECVGMVDSLAALSILGDSGYVSFKAELIDNAANNVIGTIRDSRLSRGKLNSYKLLSYNLSTDGLNSKTVKVKITISTNLDNVKTALTERYADAGSISKIKGQTIALQNSELIKVYALEQNYPNPFNPTTLISYQLPKDGIATVKVFDVLGKEVKTLVNDYKTAGKYSVSFDASKLASGVYFYQLQSNGFVSTKKMMLIK